MKKIFVIIAAVSILSACKKESIAPDFAAQMDKKTMKVESIKVGEISIDQYAISGFSYNAEKPTLFEMNFSGTSLLYKTMDGNQMETAKLTETKDGKINVAFKDDNPNGIGYENQVYVPQELKNERIITFQPIYGPYPQQAYMICSSEVLNGNYTVTKEGTRYIMTRDETPVVVMIMTER